ncbi:MAG: maleylpyruvate isomerase N-terminal domain-containing protein, partial [Acidimicrobiales bacterium]
ETAVHRVDVEAAFGPPSPISAEVARDGIEELIELFLPEEVGTLPPGGIGGTLHLHESGGGGEWLLDLDQGRAEVERRHGPAAASIVAPASDLLLFLWNRRGVDGLDVEGDVEVARRWGRLLSW